MVSQRKGRQRPEGDRKGFERLNNMEKELSHLQLDSRSIKEEAVREGANANFSGTSSSKKVARPFQRLVTSQIEKNRRDKSLRDRLTKEKRLEQQRIDRREDVLNKAMRGKKATTSNQKHRPKKSMSVLMHFMRPISTAFTADGPSLIKRTPAELDFIPTHKPAHVASIVDVRIVQFINNERSFTFQLNTDDGGHYLLQAMNKKDMLNWIDVITRISNDAAQRRLTYQGNSPKPQLSDHLHSRPLVASRDPTAGKIFSQDRIAKVSI
jgi:GTPase-activating protein BEM2